MNESEIHKLIEKSRKIVEDTKLDENYKKEAFGNILLGLILSKSEKSPHKQIENNVMPTTNATASQTGKKTSHKEFLISKSPKFQFEKTLCLAYFEEKYNRKESWSNQDISNAYQKAKEPKPKNLSDQIYKCKVKGWVMEATDGAYTITNSGEKIVERGFQNES